MTTQEAIVLATFVVVIVIIVAVVSLHEAWQRQPEQPPKPAYCDGCGAEAHHRIDTQSWCHDLCHSCARKFDQRLPEFVAALAPPAGTEAERGEKPAQPKEAP